VLGDIALLAVLLVDVADEQQAVRVMGSEFERFQNVLLGLIYLTQFKVGHPQIALGVNGRGDFGDVLAVELDSPGILATVSGRGGMFVKARDLGRRLVVGGQADLHHIVLNNDTERRGQESVGCADAQDGLRFRQLAEIGIIGGRENQVIDGDGKGYHRVSGILQSRRRILCDGIVTDMVEDVTTACRVFQ
jgi:hypothetical protein